MGKGKRLRRERRDRTIQQSSSPLGPADADYPFVVDNRIATELGETGLAELAANLWPKDCQTCGWELGSDRPTVCVRDYMVFASATLHHQRCQPAQWHDTVLISQNTPLTTFDLFGFLMVGQSGGEREDRPVMLVNPSLECVMLQPTGDTWQVNTVARYRKLGLRTPMKDMVIDKAIPDMVADLDHDELTVTIDDTGESWSLTCNVPYREAIRDFGGVHLAITTAMVPSQMQNFGDFIRLMQSGQVTMGWIALRGAARPLDESNTAPAPNTLKTFIAHWGNGHATVGELVATTDQSLTPPQAQAWATTLIDAPADALQPWTPVRRDPYAWHAVDALSAKQYVVRQHTDAWKLLRAHSHLEGSANFDQSEAEDWATRVVRIHGDHRILGWVPGAATASREFTTLYGAGAPR